MSDMELLAAAKAQKGSLRKVAADIGVSITTLSLIQGQKYRSTTEPTFRKLREKFGHLAEAC